ncbi:MAG: polynucleotide adenylyltransferase PcnB [Kiritimatiellae bacterium]|nr:polynucleotide adenylyltransferase PcnB [Kiritimatiellia bacterium]
MFSLFRAPRPVVLARADHCISRKDIDHDALRVLYRLHDNGYEAYLVGGGVRDLLLGRKPKDFDVGTNARPNEIKKMFRNCFLIGKRFRLAHIVYDGGKKIIETSTFRKAPPQAVQTVQVSQGTEVAPETEGAMLMDDNTFGTPEEDAQRRDFTVNGLFYNIADFSVIDYVGGLKDLQKRVIRSIGDPEIRFREDPVRMMRAVKFAARLDFTIDRAARRAITKYHDDILMAAPPRVSEEVFRLFSFSSSAKSFRLLWETKLLQTLFPKISSFVDRTGGPSSPQWDYLQAFDNLPENDEVQNAARLAILLYPVFHSEFQQLPRSPRDEHRGRGGRWRFLQNFEREVLANVAIPRGTVIAALNCLFLLPRLRERPGFVLAPKFSVCSRDFPNLMTLARAVYSVEGQPCDLLDEWQALRDSEMGHLYDSRRRQEDGEEKEIAERESDREMGSDTPRPRKHFHRRRSHHRFHRGRRGEERDNKEGLE